MKSNLAIPTDKMIPITYARRNLGALVKRLADEGEVYLMRGSKIAAILSFPETNRSASREKIINEVFGAWKNTDLDNDALWKKILVKERTTGTKKHRIRL